jgi:hypothetical protein
LGHPAICVTIRGTENNVLAERIVPDNIWRSQCLNYIYFVTQSIAAQTSRIIKTERQRTRLSGLSKLATDAITKSAEAGGIAMPRSQGRPPQELI